jgi:hypothetical protein
MAELALGGIELAVRPRARSGQCLHDTNLAVVAAGVERRICEDCGHLSIGFVSEVSGPVRRGHFSRPADDLIGSGDAVFYPFSDVEWYGVRRRSHPDPATLLTV